MAFLYVLQAGDGMVQGDRYRVDIDCRPKSAVHLTTQAATKVYKAHDNFVTQSINLRTGQGAILEYRPEPVIPHRGSRLFQRTHLTADPESTMLIGETVLAGRGAYGEEHGYDLYWAETELRDVHGCLLFADTMRLIPLDGNVSDLLGGHVVVATVYVITREMKPTQIVEAIRAALAPHTDVLGGASALPNDCGAAMRLLGHTPTAVHAAVESAWNAVRVPLVGAPMPNLRKG
jgi:urease accessory protein